MLVRTPRDLGLLIRERRKKLGLDQQELAKKVGVSRLWVIEIERGKPRAEIGLVIWLPMALGRNSSSNSFLGANYLTVVSVYSLLLLSEVCFWNSFGFDRSAAQIYFLAPVPFSRVPKPWRQRRNIAPSLH